MAGQHLVLYDGVCGLCNRLVQFLLPRDEAGLFDFASLQSETGRSWLTRFGRRADDLDTMVVITGYRGESPAVLTKAHAALFIASKLGQPWRAFSVVSILPEALLNAGYNLVARSRYRVFGRLDRCALPRPEQKHRFIDI